MKVECILFDLDGTLWDYSHVTSNTWAKVYAQLPEALTPPTPGQVRRCSGMTPQQVCDVLLPGIAPKRQMEIFNLCTRMGKYEDMDLTTCLYPGTLDMLALLSQEYPLFLVSNCSQDYLDHCLSAIPLERYFVQTAAYGTMGNGKSENITNLMERHGYTNGIYVGDTHMDYQAACKAGTEFLFASYGFGQVPEARYQAGAVREIPDCIRRMEAEER